MSGRNYNEERNRILKTISNDFKHSVERQSKDKKGNITIIISIIAIIAAFVSPLLINAIEGRNKPLLLSDKISLYKEGESESYNIEFYIKQGGLKKVYVAIPTSDGEIVYNNIIENFDNKSIKIIEDSVSKKVDVSEIVVSTKSIFKENMRDSINGNIFIKTIDNFALVLLDSTGQWWIYYFITSPEIEPQNVQYSLQVFNQNGEIIAEMMEDVQVQAMQTVVIDGTLTSVASIRQQIEALNGEYEFFKTPRSFKGKNGEEFTSNPVVQNIYEPPKPEEIFSNIQKIHDDIKEFSL